MVNSTVELIYKRKFSSLNYINNAIDYLEQLKFYVSAKYEYTEIVEHGMPQAIFILTSEEHSSCITEDQWKYWRWAEDNDIPIYIIYKRKGTDILTIYTGNATSWSKGYDNYARIGDFKRTDFEEFKMPSHKVKTKCSPIPDNKNNIEELLLLLI